MNKHEKINYVEFSAKDFEQTLYLRNWHQLSPREKNRSKKFSMLFAIGVIIWVTEFISLHTGGPSLFNWYID